MQHAVILLLGINNAGTIGGYFGAGTTTHPNKGYTLVPPCAQANYTNENFPGSVQTQAVGINNGSPPVTVGFWVDANGSNFGFVNQNGSFTNVNNPNTPATVPSVNPLLGANDLNVAAGFYVDMNGDAQAYLYSIGGNSFSPIILPISFNATMTTATGVNDSGVVSGFYVDNAGNTHGFIDKAGSFTSLDDPMANGNTMFLGLNNLGQLVGSFVDGNDLTHGLVYNSPTAPSSSSHVLSKEAALQ